MQRTLAAIRGDLGASLLTVACAIHCLCAPLVAGALPLLVTPRLEVGLSLGLVALSFVVALRGSLRHGSWGSFVLLGLGYTALAIKLGGDSCCRPSGENALLVALSTCGILGAHLLNASSLLRCDADRRLEEGCACKGSARDPE